MPKIKPHPKQLYANPFEDSDDEHAPLIQQQSSSTFPNIPAEIKTEAETIGDADTAIINAEKNEQPQPNTTTQPKITDCTTTNLAGSHAAGTAGSGPRH